MSYTPWRIKERIPFGGETPHYDIWEAELVIVENVYSLKDAESIVRDHNSAPLLLEALDGLIDVLPIILYDSFEPQFKKAVQAIKEATQ